MARTLEVVPKTAWLTVNRACNFRCRWCNAEGTECIGKDELDIDTAKRITMIIKKLGIDRISIIGGEPTLWRHLLEFNVFCKEISMKTCIVTNAALFGLDSFWKEYLLSPCDEISISVKGASSEELKNNTSVQDYKNVINGIARAIEYYKTGINVVLNNLNSGFITEYAVLAKEINAIFLNISFCSVSISDKATVSDYVIEPHVIVDIVTKQYPRINQLMDGNVFFEMNIPFCVWLDKFLEELIKRDQITSGCHVFKKCGLIFDTNSQLLICNALYDYPIGTLGNDFFDSKSLLAHVNKPKIVKYYKELSRKPSVYCDGCKWYDKCGGGCPLNWSIYDPDEIISNYI